jgi:hypothetical protein
LLVREATMIPKYNIEYGMEFKRQAQTFHYQTDDPVECEEFLEELLEKKFRVVGIHHEGVPLTQHEFDKMIKTAAGMLAATRIRSCLNITAEEEKYRFGFSS